MQYSVSRPLASFRGLTFVGQSPARNRPDNAAAAFSSGRLRKSSQSPSGSRLSGTFFMPYNVRSHRRTPGGESSWRRVRVRPGGLRC